MATSILIADAHAIVRLGVAAALKSERPTIYEADNGRDAVRLAMKHRPDITITEIPLPQLHGIAAASQITESGASRVLFLSDVQDDPTIEWCKRAGMSGFLGKQYPWSMLLEAVRTIKRGGEWFDPVVQKHMLRYAHMPGYARRGPTPLTEREMEVGYLIAEGKRQKEVADELGMSEKTVKRHLENLRPKLGARDDTDIVRYFIGTGQMRAGRRW